MKWITKLLMTVLYAFDPTTPKTHRLVPTQVAETCPPLTVAIDGVAQQVDRHPSAKLERNLRTDGTYDEQFAEWIGLANSTLDVVLTNAGTSLSYDNTKLDVGAVVLRNSSFTWNGKVHLCLGPAATTVDHHAIAIYGRTDTQLDGITVHDGTRWWP